MPNIRLDHSRVDRLRPRRQAYVVRDSAVRGFGVRVRRDRAPSGCRRSPGRYSTPCRAVAA